MKKALQHLPTRLLFVVMLLLAVTSVSLIALPGATHAQPLTTSLTIPKIEVEDSNWIPQKYFQAGSEVRFVLYVHNPSNFPDYVTMQPQVLYGNGAVLFNFAKSSTVIGGNSNPGIYWGIVLPNNVPSGLYLFRAYVSDSQGTVEGYAVWTVSHSANAITWAKARLGNQSWNGLCELFVENAWNTSEMNCPLPSCIQRHPYLDQLVA